jgi:hypothetical protein
LLDEAEQMRGPLVVVAKHSTQSQSSCYTLRDEEACCVPNHLALNNCA